MAGPDLPQEVFIKIFSDVPLKSKGNIRLTCFTWYQHCGTRSILSKEKFVFRHFYSLQEIDNFLVNCLQPLCNVEFHRIKFVNTLRFWQTRGAQLQSLTFCNCDNVPNLIVEILTHCVNLKVLDITSNVVNIDIQFFNCFTSHVRQQKELITFRLIYGNCSIIEGIFESVFRIFPNITTFSIGCETNCRPKSSPQIMETDFAINYGNIRELNLNVSIDANWLLNLARNHDLNLVKLEVMFLISAPSDVLNILQNFFLTQSDLQVLKVSVHQTRTDNHTFMKKFVSFIFKSCPKLTEFRSKNIVVLNEDEYIYLCQHSSNWKCLELATTSEDGNSVPKNVPNVTFTELETYIGGWPSNMNDYNITIPILKNCKNLKRLELSSCHKEAVVKLYKTLVHLETFIVDINNCSQCPFFGDALEASSPTNQPQNLKHFSIFNLPSEEVQPLLVELSCPKLKYLQISSLNNVTIETLMQIASKFPNLEYLLFTKTTPLMNLTKKLCENMKNLIVFGCSAFDEAEKTVQNLFSFCPNLQCAIQYDDNDAFYYDRHKNEIYITNVATLKFNEEVNIKAILTQQLF